MAFPLNKIMEVHWQDANGLSGWKDISVYNEHQTANCKTVGYLLKRTSKTITLALSQCDNADINSAIIIPLAWTTKIRILRRG